MRRYWFSIWLLLMPLGVLAQQFIPNPDWRFENFNSENHFITREMSDIAMDKHGYVWTSGNGVQKFDGYRVIDYNSFNQAKGSLKSNYTSLIADNNGRIWITAYGLCYYDDAANKFVYIHLDAKHKLTDIN